MITIKDKIGYILMCSRDEKKEYKFIEAKIKSIKTTKKGTFIYTNEFRPLDAEDVELNTEMIKNGKGCIMCNEAFITNKELSEHFKKVVDYWNEHGAKSILEELMEETDK